MTITLNHTIIPARDKEAAASLFAQLFGLSFEATGDHFAPVRVNETLTLLFDDNADGFESHHYAFHVNDAEFDAILQRVRQRVSLSGAHHGPSTTASSMIGIAAGASISRIAMGTS